MIKPIEKTARVKDRPALHRKPKPYDIRTKDDSPQFVEENMRIDILV